MSKWEYAISSQTVYLLRPGGSAQVTQRLPPLPGYSLQEVFPLEEGVEAAPLWNHPEPLHEKRGCLCDHLCDCLPPPHHHHHSLTLNALPAPGS